MAKIVASLDSVTFSYDGVDDVIHDVSLRLEESRTYALIGPNGAGKSTIVGIFSGVLEPTAGSVLVDGATDRVDRRKRTACVSQQLSLFPHLSVAENLYLSTVQDKTATFYHNGTMCDCAAEALRAIGAQLPLSERCGSLPFPSRQKVEIARALLRHPRVLFLDEPTSALDATARRDLYRVLRRIGADGVTVVLVTHDRDEVQAINATPIYMNDGRVLNGQEASFPAGNMSSAVGEEVASPTVTHAVAQFEIQDHIRRKQACVSVPSGNVAAVVFDDALERAEAVQAMLWGGGQYSTRVRVPPCDWEMLPSGGRKGTTQIVSVDKRNDRLFPSLSVIENVALLSGQESTLAFRRLEDDRATVCRLAREVRIVFPSETSCVATMSGGNQQRLLLASIAEQRPEILVVEEPLLGVDERSHDLIWGCVRRYLQNGGRVILATCFPSVYRRWDAHIFEMIAIPVEAYYDARLS